MGKEFERLSANGEKIGEQPRTVFVELAQAEVEVVDTSCGIEEEGHHVEDNPPTATVVVSQNR